MTGKLELACPWWKQSLRRYLLGWPLTAGCIAADMFVMWTLLELQVSRMAILTMSLFHLSYTWFYFPVSVSLSLSRSRSLSLLAATT